MASSLLDDHWASDFWQRPWSDSTSEAGVIDSSPRPRPQRIHALAVLPLENLSGDPAQEYFADGMTDELITMIAKNLQT